MERALCLRFENFGNLGGMEKAQEQPRKVYPNFRKFLIRNYRSKVEFPPQWNFGFNCLLCGFRFFPDFWGNVHRKFPYHLSPSLNFRNLRLNRKLS